MPTPWRAKRARERRQRRHHGGSAPTQDIYTGLRKKLLLRTPPRRPSMELPMGPRSAALG
eukprot:5945031-Pyramimonas_sp.AAC.1